MKKKSLLLIITLLVSINIFGQSIDDNRPLLKTIDIMYFSRNDSIFFAICPTPQEKLLDSNNLHIHYIQHKLSPKYSKEICDYRRFRKRIFKTKTYKKYHKIVDADFECIDTGIYITYSCDKKTKIIRFFNIEYRSLTKQ
jgi:hypothetical protein